jgi:hypothetical protein
MDREPLLTTATVTALVTALIAVAVAFGLPIDDDKQAAILGFLGVLVPLVTALAARGSVTSVKDPRDADGTPLVRAPDA